MNARASATTADRGAWADGVRRVSIEAAGVVVLQVVQPEDMPELLAYALVGDQESVRLTRLVAHALQGIERAPRNRPMLCGSCPRSLRSGRFSIVCVIPHRDDAREALTLGICRRCGTDHAAVVRAARRALARIWPELRSIDINPTAGRA